MSVGVVIRSERVIVRFPDGEDGKRVIFVDNDKVAALHRLCRVRREESDDVQLLEGWPSDEKILAAVVYVERGRGTAIGS